MAWKKPANTPKKNDPSFPDPKYGKGTSIQYEELQQNELIALEAIYGDDFRRLKQTQTAWQVSAAVLGFRRVQSPSDAVPCLFRSRSRPLKFALAPRTMTFLVFSASS